MHNQIGLNTPTWGGDILTLLVLALLLAGTIYAFRSGGFLVKVISGIFALGLLGLLLETLRFVSGSVTLLLLSVAFTVLAAALIDRDSERRLTFQNILGFFLIVVGILSTIFWLNAATSLGFDGTLSEAFRYGWDSIRQIFGSGEIVYDQINP